MLVVGLIVTFLVIYLTIQIYNRKSAIQTDEPAKIIHKEAPMYTNLDKIYETEIKGKSQAINNIASNVYLTENEDSPIISEISGKNDRSVIVLYIKSEDVNGVKKRVLGRYVNLESDRVFVVNSATMLRCLKMTFGKDSFEWIEC